MTTIRDLMRTHRNTGTVTWIGVRPKRLDPMTIVTEVHADVTGLEGDHYQSGGKRALTLIQAEHLPVIGALVETNVTPDKLRRNIVISSINLTALRHDMLRIGDATIRITGPCAPCSRMEKTIGRGGYNAMRGHGGWYAEIIEAGRIAVGDQLIPDRSE